MINFDQKNATFENSNKISVRILANKILDEFWSENKYHRSISAQTTPEFFKNYDRKLNSVEKADDFSVHYYVG